MDLSGLESADQIERKEVRATPIRIVWDDLGCFPPQVVPVLFPSVKTPFGSSCLPSPFIGLIAAQTSPDTIADNAHHYLSWDEIAAFDTSR